MLRSSNIATNSTIKSSLAQLENYLAMQGNDADYYETLAEALYKLHALVRIHHAADMLEDPQSDALNIPPQCTQDLRRLRDEHSDILGKLDRLVSVVDSIVDQANDDQDVFFFRLRELIAIVRRHEAEEDRLFALALWHDTGGES